MPYSIEEHKHRYAAWAASRAASTRTCRFTVKTGKVILEKVGLRGLVTSPDSLPRPEELDKKHKEWREAAIQAAKEEGLHGFTHGVAAKLLNVYLKSSFVCAGHQKHPNVAALHPPVDSILLNKLSLNNVGGLKGKWSRAKARAWTNFNSEDYEEVILLIKKVQQDDPLWMIESYWPGFIDKVRQNCSALNRAVAVHDGTA